MLAGEAKVGFVIVENLDAGKERLVHGHVGTMFGEEGREVLLCLAHHIICIGLCEVEEYACHLGQLLAAALEGSNGVVKGGGFGVSYDSIDLSALLGETLHKGGLVVGRLIL